MFASTLLRTTLAVGLLTNVSAVAIAAEAGADKPPRWEVVSICAAYANDALCPRAESDARRSVLDRWSVVPVKNRAACIATISANANPGWRKFAACLDDLAFRDFEAAPDKQSLAPDAGPLQPKL